MLVTRQRSVWESLLLYTFNHKHTGCSVFLRLCWYFIGIAAVCICCSFPQTLLNKQFFIFSRNLFFFVIQRFLFEIVVRPVSLPASTELYQIPVIWKTPRATDLNPMNVFI